MTPNVQPSSSAPPELTLGSIIDGFVALCRALEEKIKRILEQAENQRSLQMFSDQINRILDNVEKVDSTGHAPLLYSLYNSAGVIDPEFRSKFGVYMIRILADRLGGARSLRPHLRRALKAFAVASPATARKAALGVMAFENSQHLVDWIFHDTGVAGTGSAIWDQARRISTGDLACLDEARATASELFYLLKRGGGCPMSFHIHQHLALLLVLRSEGRTPTFWYNDAKGVCTGPVERASQIEFGDDGFDPRPAHRRYHQLMQAHEDFWPAVRGRGRARFPTGMASGARTR